MRRQIQAGGDCADPAAPIKDRPDPKGALRWLMRTRKIAYVKLGRGVNAFRRTDLSAYVEACRVPAAQEIRD